jgi:hypothetical protein
MAVTVENKYGSFGESTLPYINEYGIDTDNGGLVPDPYSFSLLLMENNNRLLQEDGDNILL